jgi:hypothetical protein
MNAKTSLLDMILICESESDRIDIWEDVLKREQKKLDPTMQRRRMAFRKITETLELVLKHQQAFKALINKKRSQETDSTF